MSKKKVSKKLSIRESGSPLGIPVNDLIQKIDILTAKVDRIDKRVVLISDGLVFIADNCRQMFNMSGLAVVIDAITARFK